MLTSNALPMLGTLTPDRHGKSFRRQDRPTGAWKVMQARAARAAERAAIAADLAAYEASLAAELEDEEMILAYEADAEEYGVTRMGDDEPDAEPVCYCRRCLLHDDPGGCLVAEEVALVAAEHGVALVGEVEHARQAFARADRVTRMGDRYDLDDEDAPGWGSARIAYEDFTSGFRVTDRP